MSINLGFKPLRDETFVTFVVKYYGQNVYI